MREACPEGYTLSSGDCIKSSCPEGFELKKGPEGKKECFKPGMKCPEHFED